MTKHDRDELQRLVGQIDGFLGLLNSRRGIAIIALMTVACRQGKIALADSAEIEADRESLLKMLAVVERAFLDAKVGAEPAADNAAAVAPSALVH